MAEVAHTTNHAGRNGYTISQRQCLRLAKELNLEVVEHDAGCYSFTAPLPAANAIKGRLAKIPGVVHGPFSGDHVTVQF